MDTSQSAVATHNSTANAVDTSVGAREGIDMMWWYGSPMGGWGAVFMTITTVLFWVLIIVGVIALFRYLNRGDRPTISQSTPEQMLAERFARGEIDEQEYRQRLNTLRGVSRPRVRP